MPKTKDKCGNRFSSFCCCKTASEPGEPRTGTYNDTSYDSLPEGRSFLGASSSQSKINRILDADFPEQSTNKKTQRKPRCFSGMIRGKPDVKTLFYGRTQRKMTSYCGMVQKKPDHLSGLGSEENFESLCSFIQLHVDEISDSAADSFAEINSSRSSSDIEFEEIKPAAEQTDGTEPQIRSENNKPAETLTAVLHEQLQNLELSQRTKSSSCLSQSCPSLSQDPTLDVSRPDANPLLYGKTARRRGLCFSMFQERPDHLYGSGSADHIAKMSSERLRARICPPRAPLPGSILQSETEEITETNKGTPRQPETESVGSVSSTNREEGGSSSYSSQSPFETGNFVRPASLFYPLDFSMCSLNSSLTDTSSAETKNQGRFCSLTKVSASGAARTLPPLPTLRPPTQPALSLPPNVSSPTVTSASTADTSSANLDFSLSHLDESHSQYVGPFSQSGASYIPPSFHRVRTFPQKGLQNLLTC
ncbi:uncharacterized protein LOC129378987 [Poeciliopsis prolifica]|uniref:uncharacterized protein LOC129378987 n=1 Tax=Poeciliopsis prolifica TaxID=188132 RepID=UPI00241455ED|nr:uncharacterized protein LOC129378987 [Poeciliopsis prolifica]